MNVSASHTMFREETHNNHVEIYLTQSNLRREMCLLTRGFHNYKGPDSTCPWNLEKTMA